MPYYYYIPEDFKYSKLTRISRDSVNLSQWHIVTNKQLTMLMKAYPDLIHRDSPNNWPYREVPETYYNTLRSFMGFYIDFYS